MYLGLSVFRFQDYQPLPADTAMDWMAIGIGQLLKMGFILIFSIMLLILVVINTVRILFLWAYIAFSPFIVLFKSLGV